MELLVLGLQGAPTPASRLGRSPSGGSAAPLWCPLARAVTPLPLRGMASARGNLPVPPHPLDLRRR
ncbi:MAG: hypothetical protein AB1824_12685, partial [Acidobacteriota bacterium]